MYLESIYELFVEKGLQKLPLTKIAHAKTTASFFSLLDFCSFSDHMSTIFRNHVQIIFHKTSENSYS